MIKGVAIVIWAAVVLVYAGKFLCRRRQHATIDAAQLMLCRIEERLALAGELGQPLVRGGELLDPMLDLRRGARERQAQQLGQENDQLAELARKRHELLHVACLVLELDVPERARDTELLQAVRAAALMHARALARLRHELAVRDDALAAIASVATEEAVKPGQYSPDQVVGLATARARRARA